MKRMHIHRFAPLAALLFAATGSNAMAETRLKPGLWEINIQSAQDGVAQQMPKLTPQQQAQMEKMGIKMPSGSGGAGITMRTCLSKAQVERDEPPKPQSSRQDAREKCEQTDMKRSGNTVTWKMVCTGAHPMRGDGSMTMDSPEAYSSTVNMVSQDPKRGAMATSSKMQGRWLGADCPKK